MIALQDVTKWFGDRVALDHVCLDVEPGTIHVLLGASGSGKSTILRLVLGLLRPDRGDVLVDGLSVSARSREELAGRIGYVVQEGALFPHLTAAHTPSRAKTRTKGYAASR
jgi:osmoprotectant transport system ATP-binding protein